MIFPKVFLFGWFYSLMAAAGLGLLVGGIAGKLLFNTILDMQLEKQLPLRPNKSTPVYKRFEKNPVPFKFQMHLFNVTNPDEVKAGKKPVLVDVGPFVFEEKREKKHIEFVDGDTKVKYCDHRFYKFIQEESPSIEENITLINVPVVGMFYVMGDNQARLKYDDKTMKFVKNMILGAERKFPGAVDLFLKARAGDFLFDGHYMPLIKFMIEYPIKPNGFEFESPLINNTFGLFYGKNDTCTSMQQYTIWSGIHDIKKVGQVVSFNNSKEHEMPYWEGMPCNEYRGGDGLQFSPRTEKTDTKYSFVDELCRNIKLSYKEDNKVKGIKAFRYEVAEESWEAPNRVDTKEETSCYILKKRKLDNPWTDKKGLIDVSPCQKGAPIWGSPPHFLFGDSAFTDKIEGLKPDYNKHQIFADIEPITGFALQGYRRLQVNVEVNKKAFDLVFWDRWNVTDMIFPVAWIDEVAGADEDAAKEWRHEVGRKIIGGNAGIIVAITLGALLLVVSTVLPVCQRQKFKKATI